MRSSGLSCIARNVTARTPAKGLIRQSAVGRRYPPFSGNAGGGVRASERAPTLLDTQNDHSLATEPLTPASVCGLGLEGGIVLPIAHTVGTVTPEHPSDATSSPSENMRSLPQVMDGRVSWNLRINSCEEMCSRKR
jgi:hypothetical protein